MCRARESETQHLLKTSFTEWQLAARVMWRAAACGVQEREPEWRSPPRNLGWGLSRGRNSEAQVYTQTHTSMCACTQTHVWCLWVRWDKSSTHRARVKVRIDPLVCLSLFVIFCKGVFPNKILFVYTIPLGLMKYSDSDQLNCFLFFFLQ